MTVRNLFLAVIIVCALVVLSAGPSPNPNASQSEQRIYLTGGEVKALTIAYGTFSSSKETCGSNVPLEDLLASVRHLTDGYHIDFVCYPSKETSWTYQYIVDANTFRIHLAGEGTSFFPD